MLIELSDNLGCLFLYLLSLYGAGNFNYGEKRLWLRKM